ncbi:hypothetical protein RM780_05415 [Streptomyces sp. DSM 44917]|uniref:DoxX family membrane protein n=2 Tax=Streptomyces TaxID=1883 RepID=A0A3A9ZUW7_9ACTN|nr:MULTISPECIES: hypothetical protein [Streptomyces]MDT0306400.1 hypothetical protein [Streptomyces sp. DSM 44917]RKN51963.1 hypothetical protein D7231_35490 [Streptomyces klenkii]
MALLRTAGLVLAATGAAHFAAPKAFEPISRLPFPRNTGAWIKRNGATELALGVGLTVERTRKAALVGTALYTAWLGARTAYHLRSA